ncbi:LacI family transcriptional regulator [Devosia epidermidihirudinis]|uniref:LacI family transcriptional regulator n=1 Tax=Devosia epidermidihirudinis TaxID=1293439 RepID=A0A0F5QAF2_9HYPH|nr:LacI family transcriptional regulator [Devosia epidermidihirudinis]KKC37945.1 LacI family transcriptional regulator [Devosia epidermidihirudinis]
MSDDNQPVASKAKRGVKPSGKPTLKTIAQMTGFAVTTISRALNNAPELAQETRDRVQKIAAEIGYLPDRAALRLKTGRTNVIALVLEPDEQIYGFGSNIVSGLTETLRNTAYHVVITPLFRNVLPIEPVRHIVRNRMADGVIFSKAETFDERVRFLLDNDFPFISHGRTHWPEPHPYVDFDNEAYAYGAVKRLVEKGCRKISIVLPDSELTYTEHLKKGVARAAGEAGIAFEFAADINLSSPTDAIRNYVIKRSKRPDGPDGYVCASEVSALAVIGGLNDSGKTVGQDVHVVSKQSSMMFAQFQPGAETVSEDFVGAGRQLGALLLRRIAGEPLEDLHTLVQPSFDWKS